MRKIFVLFACIFPLIYSCADDITNTNDGSNITVWFVEPKSTVIANNIDDFTIVAEATTTSGTIKKVNLLKNNSVIGTDENPPYNFHLYSLKYGSHQYKLRAYDNKGNFAESEPITFIITDTSKSYIYMKYASNYTDIYVGDTVNFTFDMKSPYGRINSVAVYCEDNSMNEVYLGTDSTEPFVVTVPKINHGNPFYAKATDEKGNQILSGDYFISLKYNNPPGVSIQYFNGAELFPDYEYNVSINAYDASRKIAKVEIFFDDIKVDSLIPKEESFVWKFIPKVPGVHSLFVRAYDDLGLFKDSKSVQCTVFNAVRTYGQIRSMATTERDDLILGVNFDLTRLIYINPINSTISDQLTLPHAKPNIIRYFEKNKKAYISYSESSYLTVFDVEMKSYSDFLLPPDYEVSDMEIDKKNQKLFIAAENNKTYKNDILIVDLNSGQVLNSGDFIDDCNLIALDDDNAYIYAVKKGISPITLYKYKIQGNDIQADIWRRDVGSNTYDVILNKENTIVAVPCGSGNGNPYYRLFAYDVNDFNNTKGMWNFGTYPIYALFSNTGKWLVGSSSSEDNIYILDANAYNEIKRINVKNARNYKTISLNKSDTKMVVYTESGDYKCLFFYSLE